MSDPFAFADTKEFIDLMLNLLPATNKAAFEYGFGFGENFELDYEAFGEAHSHKIPKAMHLQLEFSGGEPPPPPSNPSPLGLAAHGYTLPLISHCY